MMSLIKQMFLTGPAEHTSCSKARVAGSSGSSGSVPRTICRTRLPPNRIAAAHGACQVHRVVQRKAMPYREAQRSCKAAESR